MKINDTDNNEIFVMPRGAQGAQGDQGYQGGAGAQGFQGAQGAQGNQGVQGAQGSQGHQGVQGTAATPLSDISCKCSGSTTANNGVGTPLPFTSEVYDTDGMHSNTINPTRITIQTAGKYFVSIVCRFNSDADGARSLTVSGLNGDLTPHKGITASSTMNSYIALQYEDHYAIGDYIFASAAQNSGGSLGLNYAISVIRLGA